VSLLIESSTLSYDNSKPAGAHSSFVSGPTTAKFPEMFEAGAGAFSYIVPANKKLICNSLHLAFNPLYRTNGVASAGNIGTLRLKVNSTTVMELRVQDMGDWVVTGRNNNEEMQTRGRMYSLGDGIVLAASDVIEFELTGAAIDPVQIKSTLFAQQSSTPVVSYSQAVVQTTSATIVHTYTVSGSGFTLKGFKFQGRRFDSLFNAIAQVYVGGTLAAEFPVRGSPEQWMAGTLKSFPLTGMILYAGQEIKVCISDWARIGNRYTVALIGDLKAAGGGGSFTFVA